MLQKPKVEYRKFKGLRPLKSLAKKIKIYGFDIETANNNKDFVCASIVGEDVNEFFKNVNDFKNFLVSDQRLRQSYIFATNTMFDFFGTFPRQEAYKNFDIIEQHGQLILSSAYISYNSKDKNFYHKSKVTDKKKYWKITFCDTLNHYGASVEQLGKLLNMPKLKKPEFLGSHPKNKKQWEILKKYNINDSLISYNFINGLQKMYNRLNITLKPTISMSSLDNFRRNYLKQWIRQEPRDNILYQYKNYYGGRTEIFKRGFWSSENYKKINVYDVNSMYPDILLNGVFPYPKGYHQKKVTQEHILSFNGVCHVKMKVPKMNIPILPVKTKKLIFPTGIIEGNYDFFGIKKAVENGYEILETGEGLVYENVFNPFKAMIKDLYKLKNASKKDPVNYLVSKLLMNGFYGKLGTNFCNKDKLVHFENLEDNSEIFPINEDLFRIKTDEKSYIPNHVFPLLALYVTSQARFKMWKFYKSVGFDRVFYSDTDCIFTDRVLSSSKDIGKLNFERSFDKLCTVKPKFYGGVTDDGEEIIRVKGVPKKYIGEFSNFHKMVKDNNFNLVMQRFRKIRGAIRKNVQVNTLYEAPKSLDLNDNKRVWDKNNFTMQPQNSKAIVL